MAARPRWARATTRSSAATIATAPASTASSCASRAATPSISTIIPSACNRPLVRVNGKLEEVSWAKALASGGAEVHPDAGRRRQLRRDRLQPHHQRREFLPAEVRARGAEDQQHRPPPHRRRGDAARRAQRQDRANWPPSPISTSARPSWCWAPIWRWSIRCSATRFAPTTGIIRRTSTRSRRKPVREDKYAAASRPRGRRTYSNRCATS